ncbi:hypothetical protein WN51_05484 [Melipona quadrifasciata]|uniref:Uncharacterized protein n=1 Tax=Melipona quadrifasciata TaxID=166423 RepID=A0A0M9AD04_9HYME|nr:hypothetical protein WN51_05484 [Melipona quadrifasciata]
MPIIIFEQFLSWCSSMRPKYEANVVNIDEHSPAKYRIIECFAGLASELAFDNYRVSVGNSACSAVAGKRTADSAAADTAEEVGSFCSVEKRIDRGNPGRNCGCTGSDKGWGTESVDRRTVAESVERLSGLHCGSRSSGSSGWAAAAETFACSSDCAVAPVGSRSDRSSSGTLPSVAARCSARIESEWGKGWLVFAFETGEYSGSLDETSALEDTSTETANTACNHFGNTLSAAATEEKSRYFPTYLQIVLQPLLQRKAVRGRQRVRVVSGVVMAAAAAGKFAGLAGRALRHARVPLHLVNDVQYVTTPTRLCTVEAPHRESTTLWKTSLNLRDVPTVAKTSMMCSNDGRSLSHTTPTETISGRFIRVRQIWIFAPQELYKRQRKRIVKNNEKQHQENEKWRYISSYEKQLQVTASFCPLTQWGTSNPTMQLTFSNEIH